MWGLDHTHRKVTVASLVRMKLIGLLTITLTTSGIICLASVSSPTRYPGNAGTYSEGFIYGGGGGGGGGGSNQNLV